MLDRDAHWRHVMNTVERFMCVVDAALCQMTLSTCQTTLHTAQCSENCAHSRYCRLRLQTRPCISRSALGRSGLQPRPPLNINALRVNRVNIDIVDYVPLEGLNLVSLMVTPDLALIILLMIATNQRYIFLCCTLQCLCMVIFLR